MTAQLDDVMPTALTGSVVQTVGLTAAVAGFPAPVGAVVEIERQTGRPVPAEVVGFRDRLTILYPLGDLSGVRHGSRVRLVRTSRTVRVGPELLGRVIDAHGKCLDGSGQPSLAQRVPMQRTAPPAVERPAIDAPLSTGIRAIDGLLTCGQGQRVGIFSGSGVGKSTLLGMMARHSSADVNVIALVGERGREVNEFLSRDLGPDGLARSVVVVATSDLPALKRVQSTMTATAVAEYFRDQGKHVLLLMDSLTRLATAQREIGLAAGEPPTTRGYPPSVFAMLPKLVERAGRSARGSITAFYSVLVEGDDANEPVSDTLRGLLDGHIVLARRLASTGHYPAIDVLESISRLIQDLVPPDQLQAVTILRELMGAYREHDDVISIGAYRQGSNPKVDAAIAMREAIGAYLKQGVGESSDVQSAGSQLINLVQTAVAETPHGGTRSTSTAIKSTLPLGRRLRR
jgi:flagellum-specific ATP synthase